VSAALLDDLLAGYVERSRVALVADTPANPANPAKSEHPCGPAPASAACEGPRIPAKAIDADDEAGADSQNFAGVRRTQTMPRGEQTSGSSQDSQDSQGVRCPTRSGTDRVVAWNDADISAFLNRRARLLRWGWAEPDADALAERLVARDREQDSRVSCIECTHYRPGRCGNHRRAGLHTHDLGRNLAELLQRCAGFTQTKETP
jgi:hypothetical protein